MSPREPKNGQILPVVALAAAAVVSEIASIGREGPYRNQSEYQRTKERLAILSSRLSELTEEIVQALDDDDEARLEMLLHGLAHIRDQLRRDVI